MDRFFSTETKFYAAWSLLADLVIVNLLMITASFPIVTIGAATRAGVVVTRRMARDEGSSVISAYLNALLRNWKAPTVWALVSMILTVGIAYEFYVISRADLGAMGVLFSAGVLSGTFLVLGISAWFYPLCALREGGSSLKETVSIAIRLTVAHLPRTTAAVFVLLIIPIAVYFFPAHVGAIFAYFILVGNALAWYLVSLVLEPVLETLNTQLPGTTDSSQV